MNASENKVLPTIWAYGNCNYGEKTMKGQNKWLDSENYCYLS